MKALLLIAHGSRRAASNDEVRQVTRRVAERVDSRFDYVDCGFLELAEPSIPGGIQQCIDAGATEIIVLPYFLSAGRHVVEDIPAEVQGMQQANSDITISIAPYLGSAEGIVDVLLGI